jgi:exodeoxyribonuclease VII small subunit
MILSEEGKAAILATIGPASSDPAVFERMIEAGLDIVRLNMSHGSYDDHRKRFEMVRSVDDSIPILFDLSGPKIRIRKMEEPVKLVAGNEIILTNKEIVGNREKVSVTYLDLIDQADVGHTLFLNDGLIELSVLEKTKEQLKAALDKITKLLEEGKPDAIEELEKIVEQIDNESISIDDLTQKVKRATELIDQCKATLFKTEKEVTDMLKALSEEQN